MALQAGHKRTLGATLHADGVNFALAAPNARAVDVCLFDAAGQVQTQCLRLPMQTDGIWHGFLPGAGAGLVYGWRVNGPWAVQDGHRFNPAKLLLDPYAREVLGRYDGADIHCGHSMADATQPDARDNAASALKARVVADLPPPMAGAPIDPAQRAIYELHVKGFTALHPDVPPALRGTYAGLAHPAAIAHLQSLGVTTLCLMPVAFRADEARLLKLGLSNYWGYSPIAWSAPESRLWSGSEGSTPRTEFRALVDALHAAGLEVILDVVYNHTAETDEHGPTLSLRGIDNASYYHLEPHNRAQYINWTGCGNCVNLNQPLALRTVMDSLRIWVREYGVDGFRFDLAPVMARGDHSTDYRFAHNAACLMAIAQDPVLCNKLMVAEPWDIGPGGYQLGAFPSGWLEWNDKFRDTQRAFWLRGQASLGTLAHHLAGSTEMFAPQRRAPQSSVNFVTAHDGFTLTDLVSYQERHNEANGEHNRDGHSHNLGNNCGVEGPSPNVAVNVQRLQHKRSLLAATVFALGTPMLLAGDDIGHSQQGNNNAYCQDNATTWLNWAGADRSLHAFVAALLRARQQRRALQSHAWWQGPGAEVALAAEWFTAQGGMLSLEQWSDAGCRTLALRLQPHTGTASEAIPVHAAGSPAPHAAGHAAALAPCLLLINASAAPVAFTLPPGRWLRHIDTASGTCHDVPLSGAATVPAGSLWLASAAALFPHPFTATSS
jgi:glycogen operon protein